MTLSELILKARNAGGQFSSFDIPLKFEGRDVEIDFNWAGNYEKGYVINLKIEQR